jgi:Leucine-rich repeat (LRR) protein
LKNLKTLNLDHNSLSVIPEEIGELENLEELYLGSNNLSRLPESITRLKKLKILWLEGNNFTEGEVNKVLKALPNTEIDF